MNSKLEIQSYTSSLQTNDNLGAVEISAFIGMGLFGVVMAQAYQYFDRSREDRLFLKLFVSHNSTLTIAPRVLQRVKIDGHVTKVSLLTLVSRHFVALSSVN